MDTSSSPCFPRLMFPSGIEHVGLIFLHLWKALHRFLSLHLLIVKVNESSKLLECSVKALFASHPSQGLILNVNLKSGIERMDRRFILVVLELHDLLQAYTSKHLDLALDAWKGI